MRRQLSSAEAFTVENTNLDGEIEIVITQNDLKRLARVRKNLESLRLELSEKILSGIRESRDVTEEARKVIGELNVSLTESSK